MHLKKFFCLYILPLALCTCSEQKSILFNLKDPTSTGIHFTNKLDTAVDLNILDYIYYYNGGGVSVGDINNDGLVDIYFTGNQVPNKLYLNKGQLQFEDITQKAGVAGKSDWNTGVTMADINGDGLLDIYVCAVVGLNGFQGHNELYINQGDLTFRELSREYNLDCDNFSTAATFFDFDLDGDLDLYLLNHAVHTEKSFGRAEIRKIRNYESGDRLFRNDGDTFTDVSEMAGIYGGANGYGLGVTVTDFNRDGFPDIYVSNDFHEDDYFYVNLGDGTFRESLKKYFGHISKFSMGNDAADINHDGYPDLITLDMLPEDEILLKSSANDDNYGLSQMRIDQLGYHYQFARNMLQINGAGNYFSETALMSGIAATDWSWSPLFADFDLDGELDLFITNGIPKRPNDLDYIKYTSNEQVNKKLNDTRLLDQEALNKMPEGNVANRIFKGSHSLKFMDRTEEWLANLKVISNGAAVADLDNDGDLDIVTNNLNSNASVLENSVAAGKVYLKVSCTYQPRNTFGIGAKVMAYQNGQVQFREIFTSRGFQSSLEPGVYFGFPSGRQIDSLVVEWPDRTTQILSSIRPNQQIHITYDSSRTRPPEFISKVEPICEKEAIDGLDFIHSENNYIDFNRQKLIPYKISDRGPATVIGDLNNDGLEDVFFGSSKLKKCGIYLQQKGGRFRLLGSTELQKDSLSEEESALILDVDQDGINDVLVASGGGEFYGNSKALQDRYYHNDSGVLTRGVLPESFSNSSVLKAADFDKDGDLDVFVGVYTVSNDFGNPAASYLLENDRGVFHHRDLDVMDSLGMVTDAVWSDFNGDGWEDLIIIGEWMSPVFLKNASGNFTDVTSKLLNARMNGLWEAIESFDLDNDGDNDYLLGNWGLNTKFSATRGNPMHMYYGDFDENGSTETLVAVNKQGKYYPMADMDELSGQLVSLIRKKFPSYHSFAGQTLQEIFGDSLLASSSKYDVHTLASGYLKNNNGRFEFVPFPEDLQIAPIEDFLAFDFLGNGNRQVLAAGNYFGITPYQGRLDAFPSALIVDDHQIIKGAELGLNLTQKSVRQLNALIIEGRPYLLVTVNDGPVELYKINQPQRKKILNY